ncbi:DUF6157 family protein [Devosia sediminis]|uniref:Uncharacterized protein n=1 Tax=Devosia sediminis TaxID=2798801 RepID=A0A934IZM5_9HYPH|nr:DUF6157 family protein [Devosia sediminis]MBJ3786176.1 hypothetical protein [Devosia sediminis]
MHTTNYFDTLILPSPDCPVEVAGAPKKPGTVAAMQYERLLADPYRFTSDDLQFEIFADRKEMEAEDRGPARMEYFSKGQPCLRSSPLVKTLGWALHHDGEGRVALVDPVSPAFAELMARDDITKRPGLRSKRA